MMESPQPISVIVPTIDGEELLRAYVPALLAELERYDSASEVIVADDGSTDGTAELLRGFGSRVRHCRNPREVGFARNNNNAVRHATHKFLFFLNNDVQVTPGVLRTLMRHFQASDVFGVSSSSLIRRNGVLCDEMPSRGYWKDGLILSEHHNLPAGKGSGGVQETFHVCGGFGMVRRAMFEELGGFDEMFDPLYWEDADLSLRARRRGWRLLHDPGAVVHHQHQATMRKQHSREYVLRLYWRNAFLFNWKHLPRAMVIEKQLPRLMAMFEEGCWDGLPLYEAFLEALEFYPHAIREQRIVEAHDSIPLTEIIDFAHGKQSWKSLS